MNSYLQLKKLVDEGKLSIIQIISPARSCSTILERSLSNSPTVKIQINDPWALYDSPLRANQTYDYILNRIQCHLGDGNITVLIKNVADYIFPGEIYLRWLDLCSATVFLTRAPRLTVVSLFPKIIEEISLKEVKNKHSVTDEQLARYFRDYEAVMTSKEYLNSVRDVYKLAYSQEPKSKLIENNMSTRITGWHALWEHHSVTLSGSSARTLAYVDATIFRLAPKIVLENLSKTLDITYSPNMVQWPNNSPFYTDYDGSVDYYKRVEESTTIEPPTEDASSSEVTLPRFLEDHLTYNPLGAIDIYDRLSRYSMTKFHKDQLNILKKVIHSFAMTHTLDDDFVRNASKFIK